MEHSGQIFKMRVEHDDPVRYFLPIGDELPEISELIGENIQFSFSGDIYCISCGNKTNKSFSQGFCYNCFISVPEAAECIIRPELCLAHEGKGRDVEWEKKNHLQEHFVYLAVASGIKVGVTRSTQIPTRWIDQGASSAILFAKTPNRYLSGVIEVALKGHMSDKTNWRRMLKNEIADYDLEEEREKMKKLLPDDLLQYAESAESEITHIEYPVEQFPDKVKSVGFDKLPEISGTLQGIKGQYLLFDKDRVLNIRKHTGYVIKLEY